MKILLLIFILTIITGCTGQIFSEKSFMAPKPFRMGNPDEDGHPDYLKGWDDGCNTGISTMSHGYYKSFYGFKQDPYMISNARYYKAWKDSYTYCRHYAFKFIWDGLDNTGSKALDNPLCIICPNNIR